MSLSLGVSKMNIKKQDIAGIECKFATYTTDESRTNDCITVKEYITTKDGKRIPNIRCIENYKREFYITKPNFRNHNDKKEWEDRSKLDKFTSTQLNLATSIQRALQKHSPNKNLRIVNRSPYVYGCDISVTSLIKHQYNTRFPDYMHPTCSVAGFDIETDVFRDNEYVIAATLSFKDRIATAVDKTWFNGLSKKEIEEGIHDAFNKYLPDVIKERNLKLDLHVADNDSAACVWTVQKTHEYTPDFISIWNIDFDIPKVQRAIERGGYDLADVFSDPKVPSKYRYYEYIEGLRTKQKSNGDKHKLHWTDQWHEVRTPSGSKWIDSACVYRTLRFSGGMLPSYAFDTILKKHTAQGKLNFDKASHLSGLAWHEFMQKNYKFEYIVYNIFDCIGLEMLDEATTDLSSTFPLLTDITDYDKKCKSGPTQIADQLHFFVQDHGKIMGTASDKLESELDADIMSKDDWIVTLNNYLVKNEFENPINDFNGKHYCFLHNGD